MTKKTSSEYARGFRDGQDHAARVLYKAFRTEQAGGGGDALRVAFNALEQADEDMFERPCEAPEPWIVPV